MDSSVARSILAKFRSLPDYSAFEAFAQALWRGEAAVMVGAGFSRVCVREPKSPIPPLWSDFKTEMGASLGYGAGSGPDALRLAQEYQTLHGEDGLVRLIQRLVTDEQWEPGPLHKRLMELPWGDVLTTNWDTLLERTKTQTPDRIYSCVRTIQDIAHKKRPRIVKLHGSVPSHKPFIFTEDDYRTYPVKFGPFVNLAQQVMLECDLCLIGFSGVDPNFLAWSGWVRDTLNISARRIRLVGVLNLSPVSRQLLEARNVTPIDLAPLVTDLPPEDQHNAALDLFFSALVTSKPASPFVWDISADGLATSSNDEDDNKGTRAELVAAWKKERKAYPGWVVAPHAEARKIRLDFNLSSTSVDSAEVHLAFAVEYVWRHRVSGAWLTASKLQEVDKYFEVAGYSLSEEDKIELCASIAAEWRRYQKWDEWALWMARLGAIAHEEARLRYAYEEGHRALLNWDDNALLKACHALKSEAPVWMMRRAGLLATLFRDKEAAELYQASLLLIRQKLHSDPRSAWLISLEGWAAKFRRISYSALIDTMYAFPDDESEETLLRFVGAKADPSEVISRLDALASQRIERNRQEAEPWKLSFKSGRYSPERTIRLGAEECPFYSLLDLIEKTGAPDRIANFDLLSTRLETAFRAITKRDEDDLLAFFARYRGGNKKILDWLLPRMQIAQLSIRTVTHLLSSIPPRIERIVSLQDSRSSDNYTAFLLELLARLVIRASGARALEIFAWSRKLLDEPNLWLLACSACESVMDGAIEAMGAGERLQAMEIALQLKLPHEARGNIVERYWPDLTEAFSNNDAESFTLSAQSFARIETLIGLVESGTEADRGRALKWLHTLYNSSRITPAQEKRLETAIWSRRDDGGWPADTGIHSWVFLELPGKDIAESLFRARILEELAKGEVTRDILVNLGAGLRIVGGDVAKSTLASCVDSCLNWAPVFVLDRDPVISLFSRNTEQNQAVAGEIGEVLAIALLPRLAAEDIPEGVAARLRAPQDFPHIPSMVAASFQVSRLWPEYRSRAIAQIRAAVASRDPQQAYPAFIAITQFAKSASALGDFPSELKELLLHACEQRTQPGLGSSLDILHKLLIGGQLLDVDVNRLSDSLSYILDEYRYDQASLSVPSMAELPVVRRRVHMLANILSDRYPEIAKLKAELDIDPLPEVRYAV